MSKFRIKDLKYPPLPFWGYRHRDFRIEKVKEFTDNAARKIEALAAKDSKGECATVLDELIDAYRVLRVLSLRQAINEGKDIPPVIVKDGVVVDGLHRLTAHILAGKKEIECKQI